MVEGGEWQLVTVGVDRMVATTVVTTVQLLSREVARAAVTDKEGIE